MLPSMSDETTRMDGWEDRRGRLREFRKLRGLKAESVAKRAKVDRAYIARVEGGWIRLRFAASQQQVAKGYGLPTEDFVRLLDGEITPKAAAKLAEEAVAPKRGRRSAA